MTTGIKVTLNPILEKRCDDWTTIGKLLAYLELSAGLISDKSEEDNKQLRKLCAECKEALKNIDEVVNTVIDSLDHLEGIKEEEE